MFLKLPSTSALPAALLSSPASFQNFHSPGGHEDLGLRKGRLAVGGQQAVDVVAVEVRDDDGIDGAAVDTGGGEIGVELADDAFALLVHRGTKAGVDDDELRAGVHRDRRIGNDDLVLVEVHRLERLVDVFLLDVADERVGEWVGERTVGHGGHLDRADLVAVKARRLLVGLRRVGTRGHRGQRRERGRGRGACEDGAAGYESVVCHGFLPRIASSRLRDFSIFELGMESAGC